MRPALLLLADAGTTEPGGCDLTEAQLDLALVLARATGGVGRVLLFHPLEDEAALTARALGFRLWPAEGDTPGARWANAFRQAGELGYEGAVTLTLDAADLASDRLDEVVDLLAANQAVVIPTGTGGVSVLALQRHEPALVPVADAVPDLDTLRRRARQLRIPLVELAPHGAAGAPLGRPTGGAAG